MFVKHAVLAIAFIAVPTALLAQTSPVFDDVIERLLDRRSEQLAPDGPIDPFTEGLIWDRLASCMRPATREPECERIVPRIPAAPLSLDEFNAVWADAVLEDAQNPRPYPLHAAYDRRLVDQAESRILRALEDSLLSDPDPEEAAAEMTSNELHLAVATPALRSCAISTGSGKDLLPLVEELTSKGRFLRRPYITHLPRNDAIPRAVFAAGNAREICDAALRRLRETLPDLVADFKKRVARRDRNDFICGGYRAARAYALRVPGGRTDSRVREEDPACVAYYEAYRDALIANVVALEAARDEQQRRNLEQLLERQLIQ